MPVVTRDQDGLSPRERSFCFHVVQSRNGAASAIKAGYSAKAAPQIASELRTRPHVAAFVAKLEALRNRTEEQSKDRVLDRLQQLAFRDPMEDPSWQRQAKRCGIDRETERKINKLLPTMTAEIDALEKIRKNLAEESLKALKMLAEYHGLVGAGVTVNQNSLTVTTNTYAQLDSETLKRLAAGEPLPLAAGNQVVDAVPAASDQVVASEGEP